MTVESATYIADLNVSNPANTDQKSEGDDHIRLIKSVVKTTLPNLDGAVSATDTELSMLSGKTLTSTDDKIDNMEAGTVLVFRVNAASLPTGWSQVTTWSDRALRLIGTGTVGIGGSVAFETAFASQTTGALGGSPSTVFGYDSAQSAVAASGVHTHTIDLDVAYVDVILGQKG